jgi:protein-L-isoaspartate(D-aspartate) O-methyltransferase
VVEGRERLIEIVAKSVKDRHVLDALRNVPREFFVPEALAGFADEDAPLPIGEGQTISQPTIVGVMTEALRLGPGDRVLEIGTGSGYQAAVLARLAGEVVSVEVHDSLRERAAKLLASLGIRNVRLLAASDALGAPEEAPFDAIIVTAAAAEVPEPLLRQLRVGGRMVIPVGNRESQELLLVTRTERGHRRESLGGCRFVPLVGPGGLVERASSPRHQTGEPPAARA